LGQRVSISALKTRHFADVKMARFFFDKSNYLKRLKIITQKQKA
jgi:hypothetical protein